MSEPLDDAATCADCRAHDGWAAWCDECHVLARDEIDRLRERLAEAEAEENEAHRAECDQLARWLHEAHKARRGAEAERDAVTRHAARLDARLAEVEAERDELRDEIGNLTMHDAAVEWRKAEAKLAAVRDLCEAPGGDPEAFLQAVLALIQEPSACDYALPGSWAARVRAAARGEDNCG